MNLHLPTLFIIFILVDLVMLSIFVFASQVHGSKSNRYWALGLLLHFVALVSGMLRTQIPPILGFVLPSILLSVAFVLMSISIGLLLNFRLKYALHWLPVAVMIVSSILLRNQLPALVISAGFIYALQFSVVLYMLGSRWYNIHSGGLYFMAVSLLAVIAAFYFRSSWMLTQDVTVQMMNNGDIMLTLPYLTGIIANIGLSGGMLMLLRDRMGEKLLENQHFIDEIANSIPSIIFQFRLRPDGTTHFPYVNTRVRNLGVDERELKEDSEKIFAKIHSDDYANVQKSIMQSAESLAPWNMQFRLWSSSGQYRWHEAKSIPERKPDGSILWHGYMHDIQEMKDIEEKVRHMAVHDGLTGLANRSLLESHTRTEIAHAERSQSSFCLMFIDMDNFKYINDRFGHGIGDRLLQEFGKRLTVTLRKSDFVARVGGDEFVILLRGIQQPERILAIAEKLFATLSEPYQIDGKVMKASASIGAAIYPEHGLDLIALERSADHAMYDSKRKGKNMISIFQGNHPPWSSA
ncbi:diguanylate cyclase domain-containing protein [Arenimonas sp.]|jgi:diguanylate cyclase (GGDEF)-like protein|uniref:diguanylate cyclase domain-containing protein n=1 Tax=Arenimonas sp. TaxID=1872635 RepID=UPI0037C13AC3